MNILICAAVAVPLSLVEPLAERAAPATSAQPPLAASLFEHCSDAATIDADWDSAYLTENLHPDTDHGWITPSKNRKQRLVV